MSQDDTRCPGVMFRKTFLLASAAATAQAAGQPDLPISWVASIHVNCSADFPLCPDHGTPFTQLAAQSGPGFKRRLGPTSFLPQDENQILVYRYDLGYQYLLHVDATPATPKVLNCSRAPLGVPQNKTAWERGYFGELGNAATTGPAPCAPPAPGCELWEYDHTANMACLGTDFTIHQTQQWQLSPLAVGQPVFLQEYSNKLFYPPAAPAECLGGDVKWYVGDWSGANLSPDDSLFDVPDECAEVSELAGHEFGHRDGPRGPLSFPN